MDTLTGTVVHVLRFRGSADGSGKLAVLPKDGKEVTVIGVIVDIKVGAYVHVEGHYKQHPVYGTQLRATSLRVELPTEKEPLIRWLASQLDMSRREAESVVITWHTHGKTFALFWEQLDSLDMKDCFFGMEPMLEKLLGMQARRIALAALTTMGFTMAESELLFRAEPGIVHGLRADPYRAYLLVDSIEFYKMDKLYLAAEGHHDRDPVRVRACCIFVLRKDAKSLGHTAMDYDDFLVLMSEGYGFSAMQLLTALESLNPDFVVQSGNPMQVQLAALARYEDGIAEWISTGSTGAEEVDDGGF